MGMAWGWAGSAGPLFAALFAGDWLVFALVGVALALMAAVVLSGMRYIPNNRVGIVEQLWSTRGSVSEGRIMALAGEAGLQVDVLRGGLHFGLWSWQYRIHSVPLVTVPQGKMGYVYARDGEPLPPSQTLGRVAACNNFQDARAFLLGHAGTDGAEVLGQRGRQREILREGVYAINLGLFVVITEDAVYRLEQQGKRELATIVSWQNELKGLSGFDPVVIGRAIAMPDPLNPERQIHVDTIGIVTIQDGPSLAPGEIIAPGVGHERNDKNFHNNYQDPEAFLRAGGNRGRQFVPLTDGTYFINRWFANIELVPKTVVPIGYVGVVVSYYGRIGQDVSGATFRHGERVAEGERGVLERPLGPGKYAFNTYAGNIILVPTTNFVLHWVTGKSEGHRYDESLRSIDLVTRDAYEPMLPLSVVVHIDYLKAPNVIQRFGDVKKLITQTLDPMLSAFFRDVAHKKTMLQLLQERDEIQNEGREELRRKFHEFDIECVDVLIGKPGTAEAGGKIETLLEQLRLRQLSIEQIETYERQRAAAEKLQTLNEAQAQANKQTELTNSKVQIQIVENQGEADLAKARKAAEADLARARKQAEQIVVTAEAELARSRKQAEQTVVTAKAEAEQRSLAGRGEASRLAQIGLSEASVLLRKIQSFSDPRLYALTQVASALSKSNQPLVPQRVFMAGSNGHANGDNGHLDTSAQGMFGLLLSLLVAEKSGFSPSALEGSADLEEYAERLAREAMEATPAPVTAVVTPPVPAPAAPVAAPRAR
ncbi:MAG TPA: SPFH domain-containing protein [Isosphaeraceae bacterium]